MAGKIISMEYWYFNGKWFIETKKRYYTEGDSQALILTTWASAKDEQ